MDSKAIFKVCGNPLGYLTLRGKFLFTRYMSADKPYVHPLFHLIFTKAHFTNEETKTWSKDMARLWYWLVLWHIIMQPSAPSIFRTFLSGSVFLFLKWNETLKELWWLNETWDEHSVTFLLQGLKSLGDELSKPIAWANRVFNKYPSGEGSSVHL